ncbi:chaplin [Streptomyces jeddahensis]|uniref:chaplin n=1 Tax=Streptomyces jeddahensis TaxID=1716141 RepID=UPI000B2DC768|nr:chaplin [Streptomyces jeddahensis]
MIGKGILTAAAVTAFLSLPGTYALADADASGAASDAPGVLSGNDIQAPVDVPVDVCGNAVDVVAAATPTVGNACASDDADASRCCRNDPAAGSDHCCGNRPAGSGRGDGSPAAPHTRAEPGAGQGPRAEPAGPLEGQGHGSELGASPRSGSPIPAQRVYSHGELATTGTPGDAIGLAATGAGLLTGGAMLYRRVGASARH